jgi:hypothetical protein
MPTLTTKAILIGIRYRVTQLKKTYRKLEKEKGFEVILSDYETRIDEIESLIRWIENKKRK